jgi:hypothetical protein
VLLIKNILNSFTKAVKSMFNVLTLFSWTTWLIICLVLFAVFWFIWGGKHTYEFIGVKPLQTPEIKYIQDDSMTQGNSYAVQRMNTQQQSNIPKTSKGEEVVSEVFQDILQREIKRNIRPDFLRNPETGKSLELDCYNPEYKIAVEYNGIQHYKFPSAYHKTEKEFYAQLYRDRLKKKLCEDAGVYLIPIPYWVDMCVSDPNNSENLICTKFVSREIRYQRIYDFLYERLEEYFSMLNETSEDEISSKESEDLEQWDDEEDDIQ